MKIVVLANEENFEILRLLNTTAEWVLVTDATAFAEYKDADAFFDLTENAATVSHPDVQKPFFIHSVIESLASYKKAIRINAWKGFLENGTWEIAGDVTAAESDVLSFLNKKVIVCADEPGFISARIIAMIINEAYYAKGEKVSTEKEIDTAMKLGTNYPYGPFEWAEKIGINNIYSLLKKLSLQDSRYNPAPLLTKTARI